MSTSKVILNFQALYEPKGRAKEYGELACNIYNGCYHACKYCYAPQVLHQTRETFSDPCGIRGKLDFARRFEHDLKLLHAVDDPRRIFFCFTTDPYQPCETTCHYMRNALRLCIKYQRQVRVLTKAAYETVAPDFEALADCDAQLGVTLTGLDEAIRAQWEPRAPSFEKRIRLIQEAKKYGIKTWVSLEPVLYPLESLKVIDRLHDYVDFWKVGKLNHMKVIEDMIDWPAFRKDVEAKLKSYGADYYIKKDLLEAR